VCRFELRVRADLETEADALEFQQLPAQRLLASLVWPQLRRTPRWRRSKRSFVVILAALGLASGAFALVSASSAPPDPRSLAEPPEANEQSAKTLASPVVAKTRERKPGPTPAAASGNKLQADEPVKSKLAGGPAIAISKLRHAADAAAPPMAASNAKPLAEATAAQLFAKANRARRASDAVRASSLYALLQSKFPASPEAQLSLVTLGTLQLSSGNAAEALGTFDRYLAGSGRPLEAEALYGRARALSHLGRASAESRAWRSLLAKYPSCSYAQHARERLRALSAP
jgi:TolA-binding protein